MLHDVRGLSVHFMLDLDGTIYQTLDVKEQAWHATIANGRSIGIEIANIGAYPSRRTGPLDRWYQPGQGGRPDRDSPILPRRAACVRETRLRPARGQPVEGRSRARCSGNTTSRTNSTTR